MIVRCNTTNNNKNNNNNNQDLKMSFKFNIKMLKSIKYR